MRPSSARLPVRSHPRRHPDARPEFSGVTYPQIGVPDAHHPITHHQQEPEKIVKVAKINAYHVTQFAHLLEKLRSTPDGDGSLLDHVILMEPGWATATRTIHAASHCSWRAAALDI